MSCEHNIYLTSLNTGYTADKLGYIWDVSKVIRDKIDNSNTKIDELKELLNVNNKSQENQEFLLLQIAKVATGKNYIYDENGYIQIQGES